MSGSIIGVTKRQTVAHISSFLERLLVFAGPCFKVLFFLVKSFQFQVGRHDPSHERGVDPCLLVRFWQFRA